MPALGLEVPKKAIDELFDEWDKDGGGALDFKELGKILRKSPAATTTKLKGAGAAAMVSKRP